MASSRYSNNEIKWLGDHLISIDPHNFAKSEMGGEDGDGVWTFEKEI